MQGQVFFDIPIYRLNRYDYERSLAAYIDTNLYQDNPNSIITKQDFIDYYNRNPDTKYHTTMHLKSRYGGCWQFNEIFAYARLYFRGWSVLGEYWQTASQRVVRTRKKEFAMYSHKIASEISIAHTASNSEILDVLNQYLARVQAEFSTRYVDITVWDRISPYIDWHNLIQASLSWKMGGND